VIRVALDPTKDNHFSHSVRKGHILKSQDRLLERGNS
jgi:hypothetical protein